MGWEWVGMGIEVMGKWEWECSVVMGIGGNGNGIDSMGVGRGWEQESHSRTPNTRYPRIRIVQYCARPSEQYSSCYYVGFRGKVADGDPGA